MLGEINDALWYVRPLNETEYCFFLTDVCQRGATGQYSCGSPDKGSNGSGGSAVENGHSCGSIGPGHSNQHGQDIKRQRTAYTRHQILELGKKINSLLLLIQLSFF